MNTLNANDLKVGGVTAIESALQDEPEVAITVRGERRFVVMALAQYEHLRECELEAARLATQADRATGRAGARTAAQHIADMEKRLTSSVAALSAQQERVGDAVAKAAQPVAKQTRKATKAPKTASATKPTIKPKLSRSKTARTR